MPNIADVTEPAAISAAPKGASETLRRIHPLVIVATGAVTLFCLVGIGVMTGLIPGMNSDPPAASATQVVAHAPSPAASGIANAPAGSGGEGALPEAANASAPSDTTLPPIQNPAFGQPNTKRGIGALTTPAPMPSPLAAQSAHTAPVVTVPVPAYMKNNSPAYEAPASSVFSADGSANRPAPSVARNEPDVCRQCGVFDGIFPVEKKGEVSGAGAVIGGLISGVLGHQVGQGRGKDVATVAGAVGGALVGNHVERSVGRTSAFDVRVRMDDSTFRTVGLEGPLQVQVGAKVKFEDGRLLRR